jgi:hypothetical protein
MSEQAVTIEGRAEPRRAVVIYAAALYRDPEFAAWLNKGTGRGLATWHTGGAPGEYSDVFIHVALPADGSDSDMPEHCWAAIIATLRESGFDDYDEVLVWLQNMENV